MHHSKDISEGCKILPSHVPNRLDLRKIWSLKVLEQYESQFWEFQEKMRFGCRPRREL